MNSSNPPSVALADPEPEAEPAWPDVPIRKADGALSDFNEIVSVHPFQAFLFRRRTFIVLLGVLALVFLARPVPGMLAAGIVLAALAEAWRIWAAGTIHKSEEVTTGGPYAIVRHPLYVGSFIHSVAYCFMSGRWESFAFVLPLFCLVYGAAFSTEETMLHKLFGARYAEYCQRVPRFIPRLAKPQPGHGRFQWAQVLENKEYVNVIWVVVLSGLFIFRLFNS